MPQYGWWYNEIRGLTSPDFKVYKCFGNAIYYYTILCSVKCRDYILLLNNPFITLFVDQSHRISLTHCFQKEQYKATALPLFCSTNYSSDLYEEDPWRDNSLEAGSSKILGEGIWQSGHYPIALTFWQERSLKNKINKIIHFIQLTI